MARRRPPRPRLLHTLPTPPSSRALRRYTRRAPRHQERAIRQYVELQAPGERVTYLEHMATERIGQRKLEAWDVRTGKDRYWVITDPTNLYSQRDFPGLDYTLSFHIGLTLRMTARQGPPAPTEQKRRLAAAWRRWTQAVEALDAAEEAEDFQAVGMRCRECLLELARAVASPRIVPAGQTAPKRGDFTGWATLVADAVAHGPSAERIRHYLKTTADGTWQLVSWLTHAANATWVDGDIAVDATRGLLSAFGTALVKHESEAPERCPQCRSYRLSSDFRPDLRIDPPYVTVCDTCGWDDRSRRSTSRAR
jgi:hypothetical protein